MAGVSNGCKCGGRARGAFGLRKRIPMSFRFSSASEAASLPREAKPFSRACPPLRQAPCVASRPEGGSSPSRFRSPYGALGTTRPALPPSCADFGAHQQAADEMQDREAAFEARHDDVLRDAARWFPMIGKSGDWLPESFPEFGTSLVTWIPAFQNLERA